MEGLHERVVKCGSGLADQAEDFGPVPPGDPQVAEPLHGTGGLHDPAVLTAPGAVLTAPGGTAQRREPGGGFALEPGPGLLDTLQRNQALP